MRYQVIIVDITTKQFNTSVVEAQSPLDAYAVSIECDDGSEYEELLKDNSEGGWVLDLGDGIILITEIQ